MKRLSLTVGFALAALASTPVWANHQWPLKKGNTWNLEKQDGGSTYLTTVTVDQQYYSMYHLKGFPGAPGGLWVSYAGSTLFAWNSQTNQWVPLFRFGAPVGTTYAVNLPSPLDVEILVKGKSTTLYNPVLNESIANCVHFVVKNPPTTTSEPRLDEFYFAPGVGLVEWSDVTVGGHVENHVRTAVVGGKKFGRIDISAFESGATSGYYLPVGQKNKILLINGKTAWKNFYQKHKPGQPVPDVNFSQATVLVALAGTRPTSGYTVTVDKAKWLFPANWAQVTVVENKPTGPVPQVLTNPYQIVVLKEKVYVGLADWKVVTLVLW